MIAVLLPLLLVACAGPVRLNAVPEDRTTAATIPGIPEARFWVDQETEPFLQEALHSFEREKAHLASIGHSGPLPPVSFLAVSGAGLLKGWTEHGGRPVFKAVTGISTGALIAPLAFLGSAYDDTLAEA